jgi:hypothetical protein
VTEDAKLWPFKLVRGEGNKPLIEVMVVSERSHAVDCAAVLAVHPRLPAATPPTAPHSRGGVGCRGGECHAQNRGRD